MIIVATTTLPAVDRTNGDRWNAARSCQNEDHFKNEDDLKSDNLHFWGCLHFWGHNVWCVMHDARRWCMMKGESSNYKLVSLDKDCLLLRLESSLKHWSGVILLIRLGHFYNYLNLQSCLRRIRQLVPDKWLFWFLLGIFPPTLPD